jgi:hypothetical protein
LKDPELYSQLYIIEFYDDFLKSINKYFGPTEIPSVFEDVQTVILTFDAIGSRSKKWVHKERKLVRLKSPKKDIHECKAYIPITSRRLSALKGARLYLVLNESERPYKAILVYIKPKREIAKGSKGDLSKKELKDVFKRYPDSIE